MMRIFMLQLIFCSWSFFLNAQSAFTIYNESNSGLSQNTVRCLAVDKDNRLWIGTDYGLSTFNGSSWSVYRSDNSMLPDNNIRSLFIEKNGTKWIGTLGSGVVMIDTLNNWTTFNTGNSQLPGNFVRCVTRDSSGAMWFGTSSGLAKKVDTTWTIYNNTNSDLISHVITSLAVDHDNTLCIGTINGGLVYLKDTSMTHYNLWNGLLPDNTILSIAIDSTGAKYIAMPSGGLSVHHGGSTWQWFATVNSGIPSDAINAVYSTRGNEVYLGSQDKGLIHKKDINFTYFDSTNSDMPDVNVLSIVKDKTGNLWAGTMYYGLVKISESILFSTRETEGSRIGLINSLVSEGEELIFTGDLQSTVTIFRTDGTIVKSRYVPGDRMTIDEGPGMYLVYVHRYHRSFKTAVE